MRGDTQTTTASAALGDIAATFAQAWGVDVDSLRSGAITDHEAVSTRLVAEARAKDAANRFARDIGSEYQVSDWNHPAMQPNAAQIKTVLSWTPGARGLLASGPTGTGKTRAITALYRKLALDEAREVRYFSAADFFFTLGQQIKFGRDDAQGWVVEMAKKPIFILDDLGQEALQRSQEDWAQSWFFRFLDMRRERGLPLIVSTNLTPDQMSGTTDKRAQRSDPMIQRLLDLCTVVKFTRATP